MQCARFEQRFQQLLDARANVEQDELLCEHARECDDCGALLQGQNQLFAGLKSLPEPNLAHDLGLRVLDQSRIDQRKRNTTRVLIAALATAAVIMVALLPLAGTRARFGRPNQQGGGGLALVAPGPREVPAATLTAQESEELRMLMHQLVVRLSDNRLGVFEPVDQLASGIRPLAITFNLALDTLRRNFPGYSEPEPVEPQARRHEFRPPVS